MTGEFFANRTPDPSQYLNTMKAIWIVQKIKKGEEYRESSSDRLWNLYIKELDEVSHSSNRKSVRNIITVLMDFKEMFTGVHPV